MARAMATKTWTEEDGGKGRGDYGRVWSPSRSSDSNLSKSEKRQLGRIDHGFRLQRCSERPERSGGSETFGANWLLGSLSCRVIMSMRPWTPNACSCKIVRN